MKLSVEHGSFAYQGKQDRIILQDVGFSVEKGDMMAILGPNGAGKTTLLRCILGFLPWKSGKTLLDGRDIRQIPPKELFAHMAYVPQAKNIAAAYSVREMILLGRSSRFGFFAQPGQRDLLAAKRVMERLHIEKLADKKCSEISGGELQMVLIARALAADPEILILDEPESNLDFKNQLLILDKLCELVAGGMTCLFNTHYPAHALRRANKALLLGADGSVISGSAARVVTERNIERAFGVRAVIGEIETPENVFCDIVPLEITKPGDAALTLEEDANARSIAVVAILTGNQEMAEPINAILHEYAGDVIGRMGLPYPQCGLNIINVVFDAPMGRVRELTAKLGRLPGVSVKATHAKGVF